MDSQHVSLKDVRGKPMPVAILFNSSGKGYGIFPLKTSMLSKIVSLADPVMRASSYINLYENLLAGKNVPPIQFINVYRGLLDIEKEELNLKLITGQLTDVYWRFLLPEKRRVLSIVLENDLWSAMQKDTVANRKKQLLKTFQAISMNRDALDKLFAIWKNEAPPPGVKFSEDDYTSLALALAVRDYDSTILQEQLKRIKNPDRQKRLQFIMPALSSDVRTRDQFFNSLKDEKNRETEAWVTLALQYLHHSLRAATSEKYLNASLELLEEIQLTGDIFFPQAWLQTTFSYYQSKEAAKTVKRFLKKNPNYKPKLKAKILQATDPLFRSRHLLYK